MLVRASERDFLSRHLSLEDDCPEIWSSRLSAQVATCIEIGCIICYETGYVPLISAFDLLILQIEKVSPSFLGEVQVII